MTFSRVSDVRYDCSSRVMGSNPVCLNLGGCMIKLKSNEFWGARSGTIHPFLGLVFKGSRASTTRHENKGGVGKKRVKKYANRKLTRRQGWN